MSPGNSYSNSCFGGDEEQKQRISAAGPVLDMSHFVAKVGAWAIGVVYRGKSYSAL